MSNSAATDRLAENEVIFRQSNEQVQQKLKDLRAVVQKEGYPNLLVEKNPALYFYCECADENCQERIVMKPSKYQEIHKNRRQFIILPGHQVPSIEKIITKTPNYSVVKKVIPVPKTAKKLNKTDVDITKPAPGKS